MAREAAVRQRTLQQARVNVGTLFAIVVLRHRLALGCCVSWRAGERLGLQAGSQVHWSLSTLLGGTVAVRFHSVPQYTMYESCRRGCEKHDGSACIEPCTLSIVQIFAMGMMKLSAEWAQQMDDPSVAGRPGLM